MAEPATRRTSTDGGKYYEHPTRKEADGTPRKYDSVTTVLSALSKDALKFWAAKLAAQRAMENLPKLVMAARVDPCGRSYTRTGEPRCGECATCVQRWVELYHVGESERRRREGSALADVIEYWTLHEEYPARIADVVSPDTLEYWRAQNLGDIDTSVAPYVTTFQRFVADYGLRPQSWLASEMTVYHHAHRCAGTLDGIVRLEPTTEKAARLCARLGVVDGPADVVVDAKSREGDGKQLYQEHALQLAPYRWAETCLPTKMAVQDMPMPPTVGGCVLQVRPDGYSFEPVLTRMQELRAFLSILETWRWKVEWGDKSIQVGTFPVPDGWTWPPPDGTPGPVKATPPRKAAPRKTAAKMAAPAARNATLESLARTGAPSRAGGNTLRDADIPF